MHGGFRHRQHDEADQRHAGDAIGSKPSAVGPTESPALSPVQSAITPDCGSSSLILKTIFIRSEPMSAILVKMPPAMRRAAAPSDSPMAKPMKHLPPGRRHEQQDRQHDQQFGGDEQHTDGDAGLRNGVNRIGFACSAAKAGTAVGQCVDADTEPGHAQRAGDADQREARISSTSATFICWTQPKW